MVKDKPLLRPFGGSISLPAVRKFVVADVINIGNKIGGYRIAHVSEQFCEHFADVVEEKIPAIDVNVWILGLYSRDPPIVEALGGEEKAETHLARMVQIIELGQQGPGLFNSWSNVHYTHSVKGEGLWVPNWDLQRDGLHFEAFPLKYQGPWFDGTHIYGG